MTPAAIWMQARGWKEKLAKKRAHEQSLFENSLIELNVLFELGCTRACMVRIDQESD
jgi:hypothetical protein